MSVRSQVISLGRRCCLMARAVIWERVSLKCVELDSLCGSCFAFRLVMVTGCHGGVLPRIAPAVWHAKAAHNQTHETARLRPARSFSTSAPFLWRECWFFFFWLIFFYLLLWSYKIHIGRCVLSASILTLYVLLLHMRSSSLVWSRWSENLVDNFCL